MRLVRRHHELEVTTAPAPRLGAHVDVLPDPPSGRDIVPREPADVVDQVPEERDARPPIFRGTCYHHAHVDLPGRGRVGLLVDGVRATLLACPYKNAEGH